MFWTARRDEAAEQADELDLLGGTRPARARTTESIPIVRGAEQERRDEAAAEPELEQLRLLGVLRLRMSGR